MVYLYTKYGKKNPIIYKNVYKQILKKIDLLIHILIL